MMLRVLTLALLIGCGKDDDSAQPALDTDETTDTAAEDTAADTAADTGLPADPAPFTIQFSGLLSQPLRFDSPSCTSPLGSSNFSMFWRDSEENHTFVLVAQLLGTLDGEGDYDETAVTIKLQEEAGGEGRYFTTSGGDTVSLTIEHIDEQAAWGEFSFSGLSDGAITGAPMPVPIWCPSINQ